MSVSRAELPEEFFDITDSMLLVQPEPQYLHASLFLAALGIELGVPDMLSWRSGGGQGADYVSGDENRLALASSLPGEVFAAKADFKGKPGHMIRFNRPQFADTTYTELVRQIPTGSSISTTAINIGSEQAQLVLKRYGGPYDSSNSRVAPYALEAFDATMGVHNLAKVVGAHLKRDFHKTLDSFLVAIGDVVASGNTLYPEGMSADNDATAAGMFPLTYEQVSRVAKAMDEANLPTLGDGRRVLVVTPTGVKQLKDDPQFARYAEGHKEMNPLFPGYIASLPEFHVFKSNTLTKTDNSSSIAIHKGQAIAPGAFLGGIGRPPSVRSASDDNYGETAKVIWLADLALGGADTRFLYSVRYSED